MSRYVPTSPTSVYVRARWARLKILAAQPMRGMVFEALRNGNVTRAIEYVDGMISVLHQAREALVEMLDRSR